MNTHTGIKKWLKLKHVPSLLSVMIVAILLSSVSYDIAFFYQLGVSIKEIPATIADYLKDSIIWIPKFLILIVVFVICVVFVVRIGKKLAQKAIDKTEDSKCPVIRICNRILHWSFKEYDIYSPLRLFFSVIVIIMLYNVYLFLACLKLAVLKVII